MTLRELRAKASNYAGMFGAGEDPAFHAAADMLLNQAASRYASIGRIPRRNEVITVPAGSNAITLAARPQVPDGLLGAYDLTNKRRLPVYDTFAADNSWPDRSSASNGKPRLLEWAGPENPALINIYPAPTANTDIRIYYAMVPTPLIADTDELWDGQFEQWHEVVAAAAALDFAYKHIGQDAIDKAADQNPYGPLNGVNALRGMLNRLEVEFRNATAVAVSYYPTADPWGAWYAPGYEYADPDLPLDPT